MISHEACQHCPALEKYGREMQRPDMGSMIICRHRYGTGVMTEANLQPRIWPAKVQSISSFRQRLFGELCKVIAFSAFIIISSRALAKTQSSQLTL
jgi:hypothetical protein